jgi:hypothetical protein
VLSTLKTSTVRFRPHRHPYPAAAEKHPLPPPGEMIPTGRNSIFPLTRQMKKFIQKMNRVYFFDFF